MADIVYNLEEKQDARARDVKTALQKWGRVEIVEASFRGEEIPSKAVTYHLRSHSHSHR
jgi:translocation protein SEC63